MVSVLKGCYKIWKEVLGLMSRTELVLNKCYWCCYKTLYVASRKPVNGPSLSLLIVHVTLLILIPNCVLSMFTSSSPLLLHLLRPLPSLLWNFGIFLHWVIQNFRPALTSSILNPPQDYILKHQPVHITSYQHPWKFPYRPTKSANLL